MSSASLLGGARGLQGGASHGSKFLGQSRCNLLVDRENERTSWSHVGAVESSETLSSIFSGYHSSSRGARGGLSNDSTSLWNRCTGYFGVRGDGLFSSPASRASTGSPAGESCLYTSLPTYANTYPAPCVCRGWEGTTARILSFRTITQRFAPSLRVHKCLGSVPKRTGSRRNDDNLLSGQWRSVRAMAVNPDERKKVLSRPEFRETAEVELMKEWSSNPFARNSGSESDAYWEQLNMIIRVVYAIAMYGGLVVVGSTLCNFTGVDCWGGFNPSIETFVQATGWAIPPMMALLLILEDEVVKVCPPARAIRDVEDEELMDFFVGMNPWQFIFVVAAGSLSEELFFRVAIQGGLAHALQYTAKGADDPIIGVSALTTVIPFFAPFAQTFAAVLTASLTGSMYYIISCPKDPTYVIAPISVNKYGWNNRSDIKKRVEAWYERRQLKKIYSPLMEALLALYLGFEWVQTGNIFGPMITHTLYSLVVAGNGLRRIHDNRFKLRQRVSKVTQQKEVSSDVVLPDKLN